MNGEQSLRILTAVCAVVLVFAVCVTLGGLLHTSLFGDGNAANDTSGDAVIQESIRSLDIGWVSGKVSLAYHKGSTVEIRETCSRPISGSMQMRWTLDGDTLRIRFSKDTFRIGVNPVKDLTVMLPEGTALEDVRISATSADVVIPALQADSLNVELTSGNLISAAEAGRISSSSTSGNTEMTIKGHAETVSLHTTSGSIHAEAGTVDSLTASCTSGGIAVSADRIRQCRAASTSGAIDFVLREGDQVHLESTSGDIRISMHRFSSLKTSSTSGRVTAALPATPGFTAKIGTTSGRIETDLPASRRGNNLICGDGSSQVEIGTTSGNVRLLPADELPGF